MARDKKKLVGPAFSASQPSNLPPEPSKIPADNIEQALEAALKAGDYAGALEVLDDAPRWMQRQPEYMLTRATMYLSMGEDQEALQLFREIERKNPHFKALYLPLALFYMDQEWPAHALQAAKPAVSNLDLTDEERALLNESIKEATTVIQLYAAEFSLSFETMKGACIFHERALMALLENKLSEADHFSREAIRITPNWNSPHNNRAQALYFSGKTAEAIAISEAVLSRDPENVFALRSLVIYHLGLNQSENAREYADRLEKLSEKFSIDSLEIEHVILALALVEDTSALWKIARRYLREPSEALIGRSWHCLAVAAVRSGKWKDALRLMEKIDEEELHPAGKNFMDDLHETARLRKPKLAWMPPAYPGADLFFHPKVLAEWDALLKTFKDPIPPSQQRKADAFFQKYPFMVAGMKRLLWDEASSPMALQVLSMLETSEADEEILRFALSQTGGQNIRMQALMDLIQAGRYTGPKIVKIWNEDREEWREVELSTQRIGDVEANAQPKTLALIEKAAKTKNPQEAMDLLRKAVEIEPTSPIAIFNLGVILTQNGKVEEGEALIHHSVEVDPNYTYGHAAIALSEADLGHEQEARGHLEIVTQAETIAPDTAVLADLAWASLAIQNNELEAARQRLDMAAQIKPDHRLLESYEEMLKEAEDFEESFGYALEYSRKAAERAHQKLLKTPLTADMGLRACLETSIKELLIGSASFLHTKAYGKKGELVSRLAEILLDPELLEQILDEHMGEKEREALRWMLESGGVRSWEEFTLKYGDNLEESAAWNREEPEGVPGRLRISGLLYVGTLDGQQVAFIPADLRPLLSKLLK